MHTSAISAARLLATVALGASLSCGVFSSAMADEARIGFAVAKSGWMEAYDKGATQAAMIAIEELNAKGGLLGATLNPVVEDTRTDLAYAAKAAQTLLTQDIKMMIVSCDYDMGSPAALAAESAGVISIFLCAADIKAGVQGIGPHSFSASSVANAEGVTMAEWSHAKRGARKGYALTDTTIQYDRSLCDGFKWRFPQLEGAALLGEDTFKNGDTSIAAQITRIKSLPEKPDVIMLCSYIPGAASVVKQLRAAGIDAPILNGTAMDGDYWLSSVPGLKDFIGLAKGSVRGDDPRPEVNEFVKTYTAKYGAAPVNQSVFDGYVAIQLWAKAVEKAGSFDSEKVVEAMNSFKDEPSLLGPRTFTPDLHIQNQIPFLVTDVADGKSKVIDQFTMASPIPLDVLLKN
jgi:branched-chain amino acid transport system substrate-binding protein